MPSIVCKCDYDGLMKLKKKKISIILDKLNKFTSIPWMQQYFKFYP